MTRDNAKRLAASRMFLMEEDVEQIQILVRLLAPHAHEARQRGDHGLHVADLGAGSGTTALAVLDEDETAHIFTYDISAENVEWARRAIENTYPGALEHWYPRVMDAVGQGEPYSMDLLLHDASHERTNVEADLRSWVPRLLPHAFIWVHDASPPPAAWGQPSSPGVMEAINALIAEGLIEGELASLGMGWVGHAVAR